MSRASRMWYLSGEEVGDGGQVWTVVGLRVMLTNGTWRNEWGSPHNSKCPSTSSDSRMRGDHRGRQATLSGAGF